MPTVIQEMAQQPAIVRTLFERDLAPLAGRLEGRFDAVLLVARGSSDNAARYAQYLFGIHGIEAFLATPSTLTRYGTVPDLARRLVIGISQSGASDDIVAVATSAASQGAPTLAITNTPGSPLARACEEVIDLQAGPEQAVAATKTYTASLAALASLVAAFTGNPATERRAVPDAMQQVLVSPVPTEGLVHWAQAKRGIVVGRGFGFSTAHEAALKLQELGQVIAQAHSSADVRHGPIGGMTGDVPALLFADVDPVADDLVDAARALQERGPLLAVGSLTEAHDIATVAWPLPEVSPWLAPLVSAIAAQRLAVELATMLGRDVDHPPGLSKVTRTF